MSELWPWVTLILLGVYHGINPGMGWLFAVALGLQDRSRRSVTRAFLPIALGHAASIAIVVALVAVLQSVVSPHLLRYAGAGALIVFGLYKLLAPMSHPRWVGMRVGSRQLATWSFLMATAHGAGLMVVPVVLKLPAHAAESVQAATPTQSAAPHSLLVAKIEDTGRSVKVALSCHDTGSAAVEAQNGAAQTVSDKHPASTGNASQEQEKPAACHSSIEQMASRSTSGPLAAAMGVILHTLAMFAAMAIVALLVYEKLGLAILRRAWINLDLLWAGALIGAGVLTLVL